MMSWTDERVETVKKLWGKGLSASGIASVLGGVTRNAVIGKVHRLGLSGRSAPAPKHSSPRRARPRTVISVYAPPVKREANPRDLSFRGGYEPVIELAPLPEPFVPPAETAIHNVIELKPRSCRWPIGNPGDPNFHFCGGIAVHPFGSKQPPYCQPHLDEAYNRVPVRRRRFRLERL